MSHERWRSMIKLPRSPAQWKGLGEKTKIDREVVKKGCKPDLEFPGGRVATIRTRHSWKHPC